jgi:hypothetical protein
LPAVFRKRRSDLIPEDVVRAFAVTAGLVDRAQRALIEAIPTSRHAGTPLDDAIDAFIASLDAVDQAMPSWDHRSTHHEWTKCSEGVGNARAQAHALRRRNSDLTFEQLNAAIGDVLYPLEVFADTERDLRRR